MTTEQIPQDKDARLWQMAQKRASFKRHLTTYIVVNTFLWAIWFLTDGYYRGYRNVPWPVWPALGWGIGLASHYFNAYVNDGTNAIEKEYNRLKNKQNNTI
jgi:Na+-driven multidrug efflux pump